MYIADMCIYINFISKSFYFCCKTSTQSDKMYIYLFIYFVNDVKK